MHEGRTYRPPRFYDERLGAEELESVKRKRAERADEHSDDLSLDRLIDRERVAEARLRLVTRG